MAESDVLPDERLIDRGQWSAEGGYAAMTRLLDRVLGLTAGFAHNDQMAIGAIKALADRGRSAPGDVAVAGCDNIDLARRQTPARFVQVWKRDPLGMRSSVWNRGGISLSCIFLQNARKRGQQMGAGSDRIRGRDEDCAW